MTTALTNAAKELNTLVELAQATGCQMEQKANRPSELRGFCPFHQATTINNARTLTISPTPPRYRCEFCNLQGNAATFAARLWRMSLRDAQEVLDAAEQITAERPPYPGTSEPRSNNSALMTRATAHYGDNLFQSYRPLAYLAQLDVHPDQARHAGIGYADGGTLADYLAGDDAYPGELDPSPLFLESGGERFAGRITIADRDHTGGVVWICSIPAQPPASFARWPVRRPALTGLRCKHPYTLGLLQVSNNTRNIVVTNDARVYIVCKANGLPSTLVTQPTINADAIAENIARKSPQRIAVLVNGRNEQQDLRDAFAQHLPNARVKFVSGPNLTALLNPQTRDLGQLTEFDHTPEPDDNEPNPEPELPADTAVPDRRYRGAPEPAPAPEPAEADLMAATA